MTLAGPVRQVSFPREKQDGGESHAEFRANVEAVYDAIEREPESPSDELAFECRLTMDQTERAILHLLSADRIKVRIRFHVQTYTVNPPGV